MLPVSPVTDETPAHDPRPPFPRVTAAEPGHQGRSTKAGPCSPARPRPWPRPPPGCTAAGGRARGSGSQPRVAGGRVPFGDCPVGVLRLGFAASTQGCTQKRARDAQVEAARGVGGRVAPSRRRRAAAAPGPRGGDASRHHLPPTREAAPRQRGGPGPVQPASTCGPGTPGGGCLGPLPTLNSDTS